MPPPKVSTIILQFNNSRDTLRCLESVKEQDYSDFDVTIVDNASSIEHVNAIRFFIENEQNPNQTVDYRLLAIDSNLGYAGGNNVGIKQVLKHGAQYVLILNPDVALEKDTLSKLIMVAESDHKISILGPAIDEGDGRVVYGGHVQWYRPELQHLYSKPNTYNLAPGTYIVGACMLISKSFLQLVGLFDERYFLYFEDADFCLRARKAGWKLAVVPEALVHHQPLSSTKKLGAPLLLRYHYRNAHLFVLKNERCLCKYILLPLWSMWIIIKQLVKILLGREAEISKAILAGVGDFYHGRFGQISH